MRHANHLLIARLTASMIALCLALPTWSATLSFALFGDVHMTPAHQGYLKGMLDNMAKKNEALAIFTGGLKSAEQSCQDQNLLAAYPVLVKAPLPTIYIPGDAEWLRCTGFSQEAQLALLRKTYYSSDRSLGDPSLALTRQPDYPELMRWQTGPALFTTLNITGDNNQWGSKTDPSTEYQNRNNAGLSWLRESFQAARDANINVLVIAMHGDPEFDNPGVSQSPKGYTALLDLLKAETEAFPGQVLLAHGGSGVHRIDHPLLDANNLPLQNFTRVSTYGALQQGWVQVFVEKNGKAADNDPVNHMLFRFESFPWPPLSYDDGSDDGASNAPVSAPIQ